MDPEALLDDQGGGSAKGEKPVILRLLHARLAAVLLLLLLVAVGVRCRRRCLLPELSVVDDWLWQGQRERWPNS